MIISEEYGESLRKCEWCGKSKVSDVWSGKKGIYCSFRCSAAGSYRMYVAVSIIVSIMTAMITILLVMMQIESSSSEPIPLILIFPIILLIGLDMSFIYAAYVGRSMKREKHQSIVS
ncbi:MAG: hypothetical protein ACTSSE_18100 [Candidatus Thorarchaeota archaeon]